MPIVKIREHEPFEVALRRFKRTCEKAGIVAEMRRHEFYEKPTWKRKRERAQAEKRLSKKLFRERNIGKPTDMKSKRTTRGLDKRKTRNV